MKKQVKEKGINVSHGAVFKGMPYFIYYVASMEGMIAFTKDLWHRKLEKIELV